MSSLCPAHARYVIISIICRSCHWRPSRSRRPPTATCSRPSGGSSSAPTAPASSGPPAEADGPAMSIVYYVPTDSDELLVSTMRGREQGQGVARHGKVSLCVLDERWPFSYLQVYCDAVGRRRPRPRRRRDDGGRPAACRASRSAEDARPFVAAMAAEERPGRPALPALRHLRPAAPAPPLATTRPSTITHWVSASMPWDVPLTASSGVTALCSPRPRRLVRLSIRRSQEVASTPSSYTRWPKPIRRTHVLTVQHRPRREEATQVPRMPQLS